MNANPRQSTAAHPGQITRLRVCVLAMLGFCTLAAVPPAGRVLVLNSDTSISRYLEVQDAFNASLATPAMTVDMAKEAPTESALKRVLDRENPATVYCIGAKAYQLASRVSKDRTIILSSAINWERFPARKQRHVIANELPAAVQLTLFRHFFPKLQRIGVLYTRDINRQWFEQAQAGAKEVGVELVGVNVRRSSEIAGVLRDLAPKVDAIWVTPDPVVLETEASVRFLFERCHTLQKPVFAYSPAFAELGATLILAPDMPTIGRQAAAIVADLASNPQPVHTPAGSEVTLNLARVKAYSLDLNRDALDSVNHLVK